MTDFLDRLGCELKRVADRPAASQPSVRPRSERYANRHLRAWLPRHPRRLRVALIATGTVFAMTGAALAASGVLSPNTAPPEAGRMPAEHLEPSVPAAFAILRRPITKADHVPKADQVTFSGASGANVQLARRARGLTAGIGWVVPGRDDICIITASETNQHQGGAGCTGDAAAIAGKLWLQGTTPTAPGMEFVAGLVPDGVPSVTLHLTTGSTMVVPVYENMYALELRGSVASVETGTSGGAQAKTGRRGK